MTDFLALFAGSLYITLMFLVFNFFDWIKATPRIYVQLRWPFLRRAGEK